MASDTPRPNHEDAQLLAKYHWTYPENYDAPSRNLSAAYIEMRDQLSTAQAQIAALKADAERWQKHVKLVQQSALPHALRMRFMAERDGKVWENEAVLDVHQFGERTVLGIKAVGMAAEATVTELFNAIDAARNAKQPENDRR